MQTLIFNTSEKTTTLYNGLSIDKELIISEYSFIDISTVSVREGYYEFMQKKEINTATSGRYSVVPVARLPISQTNMIIINE